MMVYVNEGPTGLRSLLGVWAVYGTQGVSSVSSVGVGLSILSHWAFSLLGRPRPKFHILECEKKKNVSCTSLVEIQVGYVSHTYVSKL